MAKKAAMWTKRSAEEFLQSIDHILREAGYSAKVVGSVASKGSSSNDLDVRLSKLHGKASDTPLFEHFRSEGWIFDYLRYSRTENVLNVLLPDGRVVDFFEGEFSRATQTNPPGKRLGAGRYKLLHRESGRVYILYVKGDGRCFLASEDGRVPGGQPIHPDTVEELFDVSVR